MAAWVDVLTPKLRIGFMLDVRCSASKPASGDPCAGRLTRGLGKHTTQCCGTLVAHCCRNGFERFPASQPRLYDGHAPGCQIRLGCCSCHFAKMRGEASSRHARHGGKPIKIPRLIRVLVYRHQGLRQPLIA